MNPTTNARPKAYLSLYYDGSAVTSTTSRIKWLKLDIGNQNLKITAVVMGKIRPHQCGIIKMTCNKKGIITSPDGIKLSIETLRTIKISAILFGGETIPLQVHIPDEIKPFNDLTLRIKPNRAGIETSLLDDKKKSDIEAIYVFLTAFLNRHIPSKINLFLHTVPAYIGPTGIDIPKDPTGAICNELAETDQWTIECMASQIKKRIKDIKDHPEQKSTTNQEMIKDLRLFLTEDMLRNMMKNTLRGFVKDVNNENIQLLIAVVAEIFKCEVIELISKK